MKKSIVLTAVLLLFSVMGLKAAVDPNFYIYICFGQSNMEGNAQWEAQDVGNVDPRFQMLATCNFTSPKRQLGNWYTAECPIVSPTGKLGPTDYFGRTMVKTLTDKKVGVIAVAMGGSPIEMFDKDKYAQKLKDNPTEWWATLAKNHYGGNPYGRIIEMAKKAQEEGVIKGILLHQGCSNCGDPNWPNMVKKIYTDMLSDLNLKAADVPLFAGEVEYADMGGGCAGHNVQVDRLPEVIPTAHVVSAKNLPGNGSDPWHFSAQGYRILGQRYAKVALNLMGYDVEIDKPEVATKSWTIDQRLKTLTEITNQPFAIVNEAEGKAFYGASGQMLGYDDYEKAFDAYNTGYQFKIQRTSGGRRLRLITPDGEDYQMAGGIGYLNSEDVTGNSFIGVVGSQNGQAIQNGAVWVPEYVEDKGWTLKNVGTGKYLKTNEAAKYDEPTYFSFCTLKEVKNLMLNVNPDKFLGNITTGWPGSMDYDGFIFADYWNQLTPENSTKWGTIQGGGANSYNWGGADDAYNYAKQHNFPFKFHCLVWGSQYPNWIKTLSPEARYDAIVKWMDAVQKRYPDLELIDVVNEAIDGHQPDSYLMREALGGNGETGYDWIIKAFELAHERWPNAILIYNDFNTFQWNTDQFIDLVKTLRDAGAPIDAYGCQSHDLGGVSQENFRATMEKIHNALKMPMYISEYDIGDTNDANQKWNYQQHFPVMWEADYCAGVTLWGWFYGHTWIKDNNTGEEGISGLIKNKQERSALKWLREYMHTDAAKNAKSPFPGMYKEASVYVKSASLRGKIGEPIDIAVSATMRTKTIDHIDLYVNGTLVESTTKAPFTVSYTPTEGNYNEIKVVVTTTDGSTYERYAGFNVNPLLGVGERFTSFAEIGTQSFAIVNEAEGKALYGIADQHLGYDSFEKAFDNANAGYLFKLQRTTGSYRRLRLMTPEGNEYQVYGNPGYLNSQDVTGNCCFILGLNNQNGQDIPNGAAWDLQYVEGKGWTIKNVGTGKYLKTNDTAKYDEPTYFTFCSVAPVTTGIQTTTFESHERLYDNRMYNLSGQEVGPDYKGIVIKNGKKIIIR